MFDFFSVKKTLQDFANQIQSVRAEIEKATQDLEDVVFSPPNLKDVAEDVRVWAEKSERLYLEYLRDFVGNRLMHTTKTIGEINEVNDALKYHGLITNGPSNSLTSSMQLCGLLGADEYVKLFMKKIEQVGFENQGLPMVERKKLTDSLELKIEKLKDKEKELINTIEKTGLKIT